MKYRKLRIAWSVGWGILCLLLIVPWARSQHWHDQIRIDISKTKSLQVRSIPGACSLDIARTNPRIKQWFVVPTDMWRVIAKEIGYKQFESPLWGGFEFSNRLVLPYWFMTLLLSTFAVAPWIRWSNRFSLRTLLIGMTVVAALLGAVVWAVNNS